VNYRAQLVPLDGGPPIDIEKDLVLVGRREECDLRLDHKGVSKLHCVIVKTDGLLLVRDLGSTNGTRVNGQRVRRAALLSNDKLAIANVHYRIYLGPANEAPPPEDRTQRIDSKDAERLKKNVPVGELVDSSMDEPIIEVKANALPDVYPEEGNGKKI